MKGVTFCVLLKVSLHIDTCWAPVAAGRPPRLNTRQWQQVSQSCVCKLCETNKTSWYVPRHTAASHKHTKHSEGFELSPAQSRSLAGSWFSGWRQPCCVRCWRMWRHLDRSSGSMAGLQSSHSIVTKQHRITSRHLFLPFYSTVTRRQEKTVRRGHVWRTSERLEYRRLNLHAGGSRGDDEGEKDKRSGSWERFKVE